MVHEKLKSLYAAVKRDHEQLQAENVELNRKYMQAYNEACDDLNGKFKLLEIRTEALENENALLRETMQVFADFGDEFARDALAATPETAKVQAVLDAADEWSSSWQQFCSAHLETRGGFEDAVECYDLGEAVRARRGES